MDQNDVHQMQMKFVTTVVGADPTQQGAEDYFNINIYAAENSNDCSTQVPTFEPESRDETTYNLTIGGDLVTVSGRTPVLPTNADCQMTTDLYIVING
jgi:hypothetical protein